MKTAKFRAIYKSPHTDEPHKLLIGAAPITVEDMVYGAFQVDFHDGSYLISDEMDAQYTTWEMYTGKKDSDDVDICEGDLVSCYLDEGTEDDDGVEKLVYWGTGEVSWNENSACFRVPIKGHGLLLSSFDKLVVVGNKWEKE